MHLLNVHESRKKATGSVGSSALAVWTARERTEAEGLLTIQGLSVMTLGQAQTRLCVNSFFSRVIVPWTTYRPISNHHAELSTVEG